VLKVGSSVPAVLAPHQAVSGFCVGEIGGFEFEATVPGIVSFGPATDHPAFGSDPKLGVMLAGEAVGETHILAKITIPGERVVEARRIDNEPVVVVPATN
jgi:hypothetical protein